MDIPALISLLQWVAIAVMTVCFWWYVFGFIGMAPNVLAACRFLLIFVALLAAINQAFFIDHTRRAYSPVPLNPNSPSNPSIVR